MHDELIQRLRAFNFWSVSGQTNLKPPVCRQAADKRIAELEGLVRRLDSGLNSTLNEADTLRAQREAALQLCDAADKPGENDAMLELIHTSELRAALGAGENESGI